MRKPFVPYVIELSKP